MSIICQKWTDARFHKRERLTRVLGKAGLWEYKLRLCNSTLLKYIV